MAEVVPITGTRTGIRRQLVAHFLHTNHLVAGCIIQRMAEQRDITNVIDFLGSRASDFVAAQTTYLGSVS